MSGMPRPTACESIKQLAQQRRFSYEIQDIFIRSFGSSVSFAVCTGRNRLHLLRSTHLL
jgi:hypothetical protein